jgi:hypothetical protein
MWKYWWYGDPNGTDPWREWYERQLPAVQGKHDSVFKFLEATTTWGEPHTKRVDDFVEIILKTKVQHRLLGFNWPRQSCCFTFLIPCTHKDKVYKPKNAFETAGIRMRKLQNGSTWMKSCVRPE